MTTLKKRIIDDRGLGYDLSVEEDSRDSYYLRLRNNRGMVGCAQYNRNPQKREIIEVDIDIFEGYRHHKLGTQLLSLLIEHARNKRVPKLYGSIIQKHIDETPGLVEWYERMGFQKCSPYPGHVPSAVVYIVMDLAEQ